MDQEATHTGWPPILLGRPAIPQLPRTPSGKWDERQILDTVLPRARFDVPAPNLSFDASVGSSITSSDESHLITIAPTGAGKGRDCIVPNLLTYEGSMVVLDPKGENYDITHKFREEALGQRVFLLDPFGTTRSNERPSETFNPLDVFDQLDQKSVSPREFGSLIADFVMAGATSLREPFWDEMALTLIAATTSMLLQTSEPATLLDIRGNVFDQDFKGKARQRLNAGRGSIDDGTLQDLSMLLSVAGGADVTFEGVRSTAARHLAPFGTPSVSQSIASTSFDLSIITDSVTPFTLYVVLSPTRLNVYRGLLRTWIGCLLFLLMNGVTQKRLLFIIDEAAQLGPFNPLVTAMTLMRGYGLRTWTFWQDMSQITALYPNLADTLLNNCGVVQIFGPRSHHSAAQVAARVSCEANDVLRLDHDRQVLFLGSRGAVRSKRVNYLETGPLAERAMANPQYSFFDDGDVDSKEVR